MIRNLEEKEMKWYDVVVFMALFLFGVYAIIDK